MSFTYSDYDDIKASYYKVCMLVSAMIVRTLGDPNFVLRKFEEQDDEVAEYFPQRVPEDGKIDWTRSNVQIRNFVRALTRPYPGAETALDGVTIKIWSVIPFELDVVDQHDSGVIVKIFNKDDILVKTTDGFLLIDSYDVATEGFEIKEGMQFETASFSEQIDEIRARHARRYPDLTVSKVITDEGTIRV